MSGLPRRGTGLITGTARTGLGRGRGIPLTEEERRKRHERIFGLSSPLMGQAREFLTRGPIRRMINNIRPGILIPK